MELDSTKSLLLRDVYCVCYPKSDGVDGLTGPFARLRERFFSGGRKGVTLKRREELRGCPGKIAGKLTRRGVYWKVTAGKAVLEESFDHLNEHLLVRRDFDGNILSRCFFDRDQRWLKSEYYLPGGPTAARVIFKPLENADGVTRFDWLPQRECYLCTTLLPVPYLGGSQTQSLLNARFGAPELLVATDKGSFCYCPEKEQKAMLEMLEALKNSPAPLPEAWLEDAPAPAEEDPGVVFSGLYAYARLVPSEAEEAASATAESEADTPPTKETAAEKEEKAAEENQEATAPATAKTEADTPTEEVTAEESQEEAAPEIAEAEADTPPTEETAGDSQEGTAPETAETEADTPTEEVTAGDSQEATLETAKAEAATPPIEETVGDSQEATPEAAKPRTDAPPANEAAEERQEKADDHEPEAESAELPRPARYVENGKLRDTPPADGFGEQRYAGGAISYAGFWKDGRRHGLGASFKEREHLLHVTGWHGGKPGQVVSLFDREGNLRYGGKIVNGLKQGAGVSLRQKDGSVFVGRWKDGVPTGVGAFFDADGNLLYYGSWKNGKRHGMGTEFDKEGRIVFDGEFRDGRYHNGALFRELPASGWPDDVEPPWGI